MEDNVIVLVKSHLCREYLSTARYFPPPFFLCHFFWLSGSLWTLRTPSGLLQFPVFCIFSLLCITLSCICVSLCPSVCVNMEQHCLKAAREPIEGSMFVHTHTRCGLLLRAPSCCSPRALQISEKSVSLFQFVLLCCSLMRTLCQNESVGGESGRALFHLSLGETWALSLWYFPSRTGRNIPMLRSVLIEAFSTAAAGGRPGRLPGQQPCLSDSVRSQAPLDGVVTYPSASNWGEVRFPFELCVWVKILFTFY